MFCPKERKKEREKKRIYKNKNLFCFDLFFLL